MNKKIFGTGILIGALAVMLGAFGAHGLEKLVSADAVASFKVGVTYQMYHALFLLILGNAKQIPEQNKKIVFYLVTIGILLFSLSIYLLATNALTAFDFKVIALVTPLGGGLLIASWIVLGFVVYKKWKE